MLILKVKRGENIHISEDIVVTICKVDGKQVSIGVAAPRNIKVLRGKLLQVAKQGETK